MAYESPIPLSSRRHLKWLARFHVDELLPHWLDAAVRDDGFFHPQLDRAWRRLEPALATVVSQSRLVYTFAEGYRDTGHGRYRDAVVRGAAYLQEHFRDGEHGGWFWSCDADGKVVEDGKVAYGHAFAIFGLANAAQAIGSQAYADSAARTWQEVRQHFADGYGGFHGRLDRGWRQVGATKTQNPVMHLFEALLALYECSGDDAVRTDAADLLEFIRSLVSPDTGHLTELYDEGWRPLSGRRGNRLDVGHAFEWGFLVSRAAQLGVPGASAETATTFLEAGVRLGLDAARGVVLSPAAPAGHCRCRRSGYWEQCEAARALAHHAFYRGRGDLWPLFDRTVEFFRMHYHDEQHGGCYAQVTPDGEVAKDGKGSEWKLDYHPVALCREAQRIVAADQVLS